MGLKFTWKLVKFFFGLETCCLKSHGVNFEDCLGGDLLIRLSIQARTKFASELLHGTFSYIHLFRLGRSERILREITE